MRFPKAYSGVKKIFIAMILTLVAAVLGVTASVLLALPGASEANSGLALAAGGIGIGLAVVTLVALVLEFVGWCVFLLLTVTPGAIRVLPR